MPGKERVSSSISFQVGKLGQYAIQQFAEQIAPLGLRPRHCGVLAMLQGDQLAQLDIASALDVSNSVVVNMLDELEDLGAVRRVRETTDRRRHRIDLTDRGRDLAAKAATIARDLDAELLAPLSKAQASAFREALGTLTVGHDLPGGRSRIRAAESR